ncbi:sigma 54-interacting transcriptional regulator [Haliangium ochraceum]|uniref:Sigma54 specific transcriptional regulator, Fis family n=1 Tax=Haliangium ochraceum (strain DSM 14365 / JCM 11303 / SMP-2) TaxID=502025 RepID=D0LYM5_HALO1|nr:sigma 54-interacting transcriptional regulator [Haliangium ochraceum]ACY17891.1 sigma54 specific transcriptional regulator, Fis family [Haliangium ochraceum DSM 14365]
MPEDDRRSGTWVTYAAGRANSLRVRRCRIDAIAGPDSGESCELEDSVIRIGARRNNNLVLSDGRVSGYHCELRLDDRGYRLVDLGSTNGTYVSGLRINDVYITPGTVMELGNTQLRFEPLNASVEVPLSERDRFGEMVGQSVKMRELFARLERLARTDATVLITGETGVGKELVAESLHEYSARAEGPFEVLDCSAIPENLIESQLFGHERGAFTGATQSYEGVFERAHRGTVFLDEIGELPLSMQPKLLRVLEQRQVRRVGGTRTIDVDIRVVAATNRNLGAEVSKGSFREDVYYRLAVARVHVPPLRERREDIPQLVEHLLSRTPGGERATISKDTLALMGKHDWPGNVRELRNVIERVVYLAEPPTSTAALRRARPRREGESGAEPSSSDDMLVMPIDIETPYKLAKQRLVHEFERRYITELLAAHDGNISQAARSAGIDRMSVHKILTRLDLENPGRSG